MTRTQAEHILEAFLAMPPGGEAQNALREVIIDAMCTQTIVTPPRLFTSTNNEPVYPLCSAKVTDCD